ncbi:hypothetical protein CBR_g40789 [Chara braunii]|uniref:Fungal lipase-type domain-containing protein n=1 Tax=Chara braunii TaxID=69332 RepID=A0A388LUI1_CHABU|nr:hypothetical protein CBR_g40789 [Chara braunii]|eukprot:GBG85976.1 hypothetical protein CBR_g40789 [Chara braunii]
MKRRLSHVFTRGLDGVMHHGLREGGESLSRPGLDESPPSNGLVEKAREEQQQQQEEEEEEEERGGRPNNRRKVLPPLAALRSVRIGEWLPFNKVWDALKVTGAGRGGGGRGGGGGGGGVGGAVGGRGEGEDEDIWVRGKGAKEGRREVGMGGEDEDDERGKARRGNDPNTREEREEKRELKREEVSKTSEWGQDVVRWVSSSTPSSFGLQTLSDLFSESALSLYKKVFPKGQASTSVFLPASWRSLVDIATSMRQATSGMDGWSLSDLTLGLYVLSVKHAAEGAVDLIGTQTVTDRGLIKGLVYHMELARGAYQKDSRGLARMSMLRRSRILKFVSKGYNLRLVGHSLGGATACLITMILRKNESMHRIPKEAISCISFATPPCVPREAAIECADYITTIVLQDDVIPRMSVQAFERLRAEILLTDWSAILKEGAKRVEYLRLVAKTIESVQPTLTTTLSTLSSVQQTAWKYASKARLPGIPGTEMALSASKSELIAKLTSGGSAAREAALGALRKAGVLSSGPSGHPQPSIENGSNHTAGKGEREGPQQASHPMHQQDMSAGEKSPGAVKESAMAAIDADLHVPGQLVHLVRRTGSGERTGTTEGGKNIPHMEGGNSIPNEGNGMDTDVVKIFIGPVENRFARIILSDTMVSDHRCSNYWSALRDALKTT